MKGYEQLQPHQKRVVDELRALEAKTSALENFCNKQATERTIPLEEYQLLLLQLSSMVTYEGLLELRISKF